VLFLSISWAASRVCLSTACERLWTTVLMCLRVAFVAPTCSSSYWRAHAHARPRLVCGVQDQRVIQLDIAIDTIQLVMSKDMFPLVDLWVAFLKVCPRPLCLVLACCLSLAAVPVYLCACASALCRRCLCVFNSLPFRGTLPRPRILALYVRKESNCG
jgi:hypothetical protein